MGWPFGARTAADPASPPCAGRRHRRRVLTFGPGRAPAPEATHFSGGLTTLECVANVSEGRDRRALGALAGACGDVLADLHWDPDHHRSVFTMVGTVDEVQEAARSLAGVAVELLDISGHEGAHPRFGVIDVVPFVPLGSSDLSPAAAARDAFAEWAGDVLGVPCFLYGPLPDGGLRSLPEVRRGAFGALAPDTGPAVPHPTAGACAVGARPVLVAYNLWLAGDKATARLAQGIAAALRGPSVRALAFDLAQGVQVSCNLLDPSAVGPAEVYDRVRELLGAGAAGSGTSVADAAVIEHAELVGLVPSAVLGRIPEARWAELDVGRGRTIEARLARRTPTVR